MLRIIQAVKWYTTPPELRTITDRMEQHLKIRCDQKQKWKKMLPGDDNLIITILEKNQLEK